MVYYAIRSCILFFSGYFVFQRIARKVNLFHPKHEHMYLVGVILLTSVALSCAKQFFLSIHILSIQIISFVVFKVMYKMKWSTAYIITTIAYGIVHGMLFMSILMTSIVLYFINAQPPEVAWVVTVMKLIPLVVNIVFLLFLLRVRRLRSGLPFLQELRIFDISVIISSMILMISTLICATSDNDTVTIIYSFSATIFLFSSYLLWKRRIRAKYIRALKQQETVVTQAAIREQVEKIRFLTEENRKLAEIIHRDNKLIPAMEYTVRTYLQSGGQDRVVGSQLLEQLSVLTAERKGILTQYEQDGETIQHTGNAAIDIVLDYMHQKARLENTRLQIDCSDFQSALKRQQIEETDIKTILADLIENAIIACRNAAHKQVFVYIGAIQNRFIIRVFDSGIPFAIETLCKLGIEATTTHADTNGSGLGMQSLFALKNKYALSILIQEYNPEQSLFSKDIAVIFNRFDHFIIRSYRSGQIRNECHRNDMIVEPEGMIHDQANLPIPAHQP